MIEASPLFTAMVSGTIRPQGTIPMSCGMESSAPPPSLRFLTKTTDKNVLEELQPKELPYFWKQRLIVYASTSERILSVSFLPKDLTQPSLLFLQKGEGDPVGFVAPYLSSDDRTKWKATSQFCSCDLISDERSIQKTIEGFDEELQKELQTCLEYFLQDTTSAVLGLTYKDDAGQLTTHGWYKPT